MGWFTPKDETEQEEDGEIEKMFIQPCFEHNLW